MTREARHGRRGAACCSRVQSGRSKLRPYRLFIAGFFLFLATMTLMTCRKQEPEQSLASTDLGRPAVHPADAAKESEQAIAEPAPVQEKASEGRASEERAKTAKAQEPNEKKIVGEQLAAPETKAAPEKPSEKSPKESPSPSPAPSAPPLPSFDASRYLPRLLPKSGQMGPWTVMAGTDNVAANGDELTKIYDGGYQWWVERKVTSATARGYRAEIEGKRRTAQIIVHRLASAEAAAALCRELSGQAPGPEPFARTAAGATDGYAVSGPYLATVQIAPGYKGAEDAAREFLRFFLRRAPSLPK